MRGRSAVRSAEPTAQVEEKRRLTAINGALSLIAVLLIVQIWLLVAALEQFLAGHRGAALPAAIVSLVLFAGVFALFRFTKRLERRRTDGSRE